MRVITNWQTTLSASVTSTQTTIPLSSIQTSDATPHTITIADLDPLNYFVLEPGGAKMELISFTGITDNGDGSGILTGVTRGLAFYGASASGVSANKYAHQAGSPCDNSNVHYYYDQLMDLDSAETVTGVKTFSATPIISNDPTTNLEAANKHYVDNVVISGAPDASTTVKGIGKVSVAPVSPTSPIFVGDNDTRVPTQSQTDALAGTSGTAPSSSNKFVDNADTQNTGKVLRSTVAFGGSGADGALTISSGVTTIDLGNASVFIKNYTTISITGTGQLAFTNPNSAGTKIILKATGNITLTSSTIPNIDCSGLGAAAATEANFIVDATANHKGSTGVVGNTNTSGTGGTGTTGASGGAILTLLQFYAKSAGVLETFTRYLACGSGGAAGNVGGSSGVAGGTAGAGGRGGGALLIECGGAWNFTSALGISVAGTNGTNGGAGNNGGSGQGGSGGGSGGSGGAGGMCLVLYNSLTANSGTINSVGGAGGSGGNGGVGAVGGTVNGGASGASGAGGAGGYQSAGGNGGNGGAGSNGNGGGASSNGSDGTVGSAGTGDSGGGGGGGGGGSGVSNTSAGTGGLGKAGGAAGSTANVLVTPNLYFI